MLPWTLEPPNAAQVKDKLIKRQVAQKHYYDKSSKPLPPLKPNEHVRYRDGLIWKPAIVMSTHAAPHSYIIQTQNGTILRRNRRHLKRTAEQVPITQSYDDEEDASQDNVVNGQNLNERSVHPEPDNNPIPLSVPERRSRYGRLIKCPIRYPDN